MGRNLDRNFDLREYYNKFGKNQDTQMFYERPAWQDLLNHLDFSRLKNVFEFGCGTGLFAQLLFQNYLSPDAHYMGTDISPIMLKITAKRLNQWKERVNLNRSRSSVNLEVGSNKFDAFFSNFVFDLILKENLPKLITEVHRILKRNKLMCITGISPGNTFLSKKVSKIWKFIYNQKPQWVGGCRPIELLNYVKNEEWDVQYHNKIISYGISTDVFVLKNQ